MIALATGCFEELPTPPGGTEDTTGGGSTGTAAAGTTTPTPTTTGATEGTQDEDTVGGPTTGEPAAEGLFACAKEPVCGTWDCTAGCPTFDAVGKCVLMALRDRTVGPLTVTRCDGNCLEHRVTPRGGGTDEVLIQWRTLAEPVMYSEVQRCILRPAEHFAACLMKYGEACSDPATWTEMCEPDEPMCL